jgi:hypothetical protein
MFSTLRLVFALSLLFTAPVIADVWIGPAFSAGEIHWQDGYDMSRTVGLYEYGMTAAYSKDWFESDLHLELGRHNRNPASAAGLDVNARYAIFQDRFAVLGGGGLAFNVYSYDDYVGPHSIVSEFSRSVRPYLTVKADAFRFIRVGFEAILYSKIYWKVRMGWMLLRF